MKRGDIWWAKLGPTVGSEIRKNRPCLIVSPDSLNQSLNTVVVAPVSGKPRNWPFRPRIQAGEVEGDVLLDQLRVLDKSRLYRLEAALPENELGRVLQLIRDMFS